MPSSQIKSRLELILERRHLPGLLDRLEVLGLQGWTVWEAEQGRGRHGRWYGAEFAGTSEHVMVLAICPRATADQVVESLGPELERLAAVLLRSEVEVYRAEHF